MVDIPLVEKIFYALMIMLLASFADNILRDLLPYLEKRLVNRTSTKIDDVIFDLIKRFSTIIRYQSSSIGERELKNS